MEMHFRSCTWKSLFIFEISFNVDTFPLLYIFVQHLNISRRGNSPFDVLHGAGPEDIVFLTVGFGLTWDQLELLTGETTVDEASIEGLREQRAKFL
jgi:hypothetical protein